MKKLLSMLLTLCVLVGVVCLVSTTAFASTEIPIVEITMEEPILNEAFPAPSVAEGIGYTISDYRWKDRANGSWEYTAQSYKSYRLVVTVTADEGYSFQEDTVPTLNGKPLKEYSINESGSSMEVMIYRSFKEIIDRVELFYTRPRPGSAVADFQLTGAEGSKYADRIYHVKVEDVTDGTPVTPEFFEYGRSYRITGEINLGTAWYEWAEDVELVVNGGEPVNMPENGGWSMELDLPLEMATGIEMVEFPAWPQVDPGSAGGTSELSRPQGANYSLQSVWMDMRTGQEVTTLDAGDCYVLSYIAVADSGYMFTEETEAVAGGVSVESVGSFDYLVAYKTYDLGAQKIDRVDITLPTLKKGCTPGAVSIPAGVNYELWEIMWGESTTDSFDDAVPVATVGFGTKVYAVPVLCAADGYIFSEDVKLYFNGEEVAVEYLYAEGPVIEIAGFYGTLTPPTADGWYEEDNTWVYYRDGSYLVSTWLMDSKGWVYLDGSGHMVKNSWVTDSHGWCYLNSEGYMTCNRWVKDSIGWCYLDANGYMVYNKWIRDSIDWCYVGANGYMVTDGWAKDSTGWCYLGADGYMVRNSWAPDTTGVCRLDANGYMVKSKWVHDGNGWAYVDANGYVVFDNWVLDGGNWYAIGADGYMIANTWIEYKDNVYRLASDGRMLTSQWVYDGNGWSYVSADGTVPFESWVKDSKGTCYIGSGGYMLKSKWLKIDGKVYYVDANGYMLTNGSKQYDYFTYYTFDKNGVGTSHVGKL